MGGDDYIGHPPCQILEGIYPPSPIYAYGQTIPLDISFKECIFCQELLQNEAKYARISSELSEESRTL